MKIPKSRLKQIIKEEMEEALKIGGERFTMEPPNPEDAAFEKLRNIMGLLEKAMLYMTGDKEGGADPTEVLEMIRGIVSEKLEEMIGPETSRKLAQAGIAKEPETVRKELMDMIAGLDTGDPEDIEKLSDMAAALLPASAVNIRQGLGLEEKENNPWAICTAQVGREDKEKYEKCVKSVKKQNRSK